MVRYDPLTHPTFALYLIHVPNPNLCRDVKFNVSTFVFAQKYPIKQFGFPQAD